LSAANLFVRLRRQQRTGKLSRSVYFLLRFLATGLFTYVLVELIGTSLLADTDDQVNYTGKELPFVRTVRERNVKAAAAAAKAHHYGMVLVPCLLALCGAWSLRPRNRKEILEALAQIEDVEAIGPLTEWLETSDPQLRATVDAVLCRLLPLLGPEEAALITEREWNRLYRTLNIVRINQDFALMLAIIQMLERLPDSRALPAVLVLAQAPIHSTAQERIVAAARWCLPKLQAQARQEQTRQTLLRPVIEPAADTTQLLQPAGHTVEEEAHLLLRAYGQEASGDGSDVFSA
jgi:hypothetical protein